MTGVKKYFLKLTLDKSHFITGIKTILECILFGVKENQLPNLPLSWYTEVCSRYDIPLSELFGEE